MTIGATNNELRAGLAQSKAQLERFAAERRRFERAAAAQRLRDQQRERAAEAAARAASEQAALQRLVKVQSREQRERIRFERAMGDLRLREAARVDAVRERAEREASARAEARARSRARLEQVLARAREREARVSAERIERAAEQRDRAAYADAARQRQQATGRFAERAGQGQLAANIGGINRGLGVGVRAAGAGVAVLGAAVAAARAGRDSAAELGLVDYVAQARLAQRETIRLRQELTRSLGSQTFIKTLALDANDFLRGLRDVQTELDRRLFSSEVREAFARDAELQRRGSARRTATERALELDAQSDGTPRGDRRAAEAAATIARRRALADLDQAVAAGLDEDLAEAERARIEARFDAELRRVDRLRFGENAFRDASLSNQEADLSARAAAGDAAAGAQLARIRERRSVLAAEDTLAGDDRLTDRERAVLLDQSRILAARDRERSIAELRRADQERRAQVAAQAAELAGRRTAADRAAIDVLDTAQIRREELAGRDTVARAMSIELDLRRQLRDIAEDELLTDERRVQLRAALVGNATAELGAIGRARASGSFGETLGALDPGTLSAGGAIDLLRQSFAPGAQIALERRVSQDEISRQQLTAVQAIRATVAKLANGVPAVAQ